MRKAWNWHKSHVGGWKFHIVVHSVTSTPHDLTKAFSTKVPEARALFHRFRLKVVSVEPPREQADLRLAHAAHVAAEQSYTTSGLQP